MTPYSLDEQINKPPAIDGFKPFGVPTEELEPEILMYEEYESIRLCDYENMSLKDAAKKMTIPETTFKLIYEQAHSTIAKAMVEAKAILVEGGDYHSEVYWYSCNRCKKLTTTKYQTNYCLKCHSNDLKLINNTVII